MRSLLAMGLFLTLSFGLVMGAEFGARIEKIEGNKITFTKGKKGEEGEKMTLPAAANVKVVKGKFNQDTKKVEAGEALEGGLKNEAVKEGIRATIVTDADDKNIVEIRIFGGKKKKE
jgi:hypothetical protein